MSLIEELFYGNLDPLAQSPEHQAQQASALQSIEACEEALCKRLASADKALVLELINAYDAYTGSLWISGFTAGFSLGGRLFWETAETSRLYVSP